MVDATLIRATVSGVPVEIWQRMPAAAEAGENTGVRGWHAGCFPGRSMSREAVKATEKSSEARRERPQDEFRRVLETAPQPRRPAPSRVAPQLPQKSPLPRAAVQVKAGIDQVEGLSLARAGMNAAAHRMHQVRNDGQLTQSERVEGRLLDLIVKELTVELSSDTERFGAQAHAGSGTEVRRSSGEGGQSSSGQQRQADTHALTAPSAAGANPQAAPVARARAAVALVQRIEAFVKAQRPALALTVAGGINARVEVERTGHNEVGLRIVGTRGPPAPEDITRIREEMRARGLRLSSVSVG